MEKLFLSLILLISLTTSAQKKFKISASDDLQRELVKELHRERLLFRKEHGVEGLLPEPIFVEGLRKSAIHRAQYVSHFTSEKVWEMYKIVENGVQIIHQENETFKNFKSLKNKSDRANYFNLTTDKGKAVKNTQEVVAAIFIESGTLAKDIASYVISEFKDSLKDEPYHWSALMSGSTEPSDFLVSHEDQIGIGVSVLYFNDSEFPRAFVTIEIGYYGNYDLQGNKVK